MSIQLEIISDVMCPWCFIGKRRLDAALSQLDGIEVDLRWRPFQLDATIPPEGMSRKDYLDRKFGPDQAKQIYARIEAVGEEEGIPFAFDKIEKSPNTLNAHRLIRWAASQGVQNELVEVLFRLFFVDGADIGDRDVLIGAAEEAGMDVALVSELLSGDADADLVRQEVALAQQMGVNGVPAFIIADRYIVHGAQSAEVLVEALERAAKETPAE